MYVDGAGYDETPMKINSSHSPNRQQLQEHVNRLDNGSSALQLAELPWNNAGKANLTAKLMQSQQTFGMLMQLQLPIADDPSPLEDDSYPDLHSAP